MLFLFRSELKLNIEYFDSKNGEKTFSINSIYFHSTYNPSNEAKRYFDSIKFDFYPKIIFLIEPGIGYLIQNLSEKYPNAKIVLISFIDNLDRKFIDKVYKTIKFTNNLKQDLISQFNEVELMLSQVISFTSTEKIFRENLLQFWKYYKESLLNSKTILVTRQFFEQKWLLNSVNYLKYNKKQIILSNKINIPIIICASGPSLYNSIKIIQDSTSKVFIIGLSSAIKVLLENQIIPDLVFSTDGGFWAGRHLKILSKQLLDIPIAISAESYIPKNILSTNKTLLLNYQDGISSYLISKFNLKSNNAKRNGTVSGTALEFALENRYNVPIYFCGLDLSSQKGFQHINPNELENDNQINDNRINTKTLREYKSEINDNSIKIYKEWFSTQKTNNVYRVIEKKYKQNNLGTIKDIATSDLYNALNTKGPFTNKKIFFKDINEKFDKDNLKNLYNFFIENEDIYNDLFPIDYCNIIHNKDSKNLDLYINEFEDKKSKIITKIGKILNEQ